MVAAALLVRAQVLPGGAAGVPGAHLGGRGSTGHQWDNEQRKKYTNPDDPEKDFNKHKSGKGYWWGSYVDKSFPPGWDSCTKDYFWVDQGDPPPADVENAVTPEILAELAYSEIRVPGTEVTLAPAQATKVNLPTWAWLDGAQFQPVSVTASVPEIGISATATAEPVSLKIQPGTPDAETYPASGVCEIDNGRIGEPYAKGKANRTPPCGVQYLRSSGDGTFPLQATVTWEVHWTGSGGTGGDLPDGEFERRRTSSSRRSRPSTASRTHAAPPAPARVCRGGRMWVGTAP